MKSLISITRILLLTIIGSVFAFVLYDSYHQDNIFLNIIFIVFGAVWGVTFYYSIKSDKIKYFDSKKIKSFIPTIIGIAILCVNCGIFSFYLYKIMSPSLIEANGHGVYADFKKNGEYIIKSGSWATKKHFYGHYRIQDGLIILDRECLDDILSTDKYRICELDNPKNSFLYWKIKKKGTYIIPIDKRAENKNSLYLLGFDHKGDSVFGSHRFEITNDNR
ncbi:MAG: hypothetical protein U0W24_16080 [Bacteroidales bacterium]